MIASMGHAGRFPRTGNRGRRSGANVGNTREIWPCADGFVSFGLRGGRARVANLQTITRLVNEDGLATPALTDRDWTTYDHTKMTPEELEEISAPIAAYFERHKMAELYEIACDTNLMLAPANSPRELVESKQLAERDFFCTVEGLGRVPRSFVHVTSPGDAVARPGPAAAAGVGTRTTPPRESNAAGSRAPRGPARRSSSSEREPQVLSRCATSRSTVQRSYGSSRGRDQTSCELTDRTGRTGSRGLTCSTRSTSASSG